MAIALDGMNMKWLIFLLMMLTLIACAQTGHWVPKENQSKEEFWDDNTKCHAYSEWALRIELPLELEFQSLNLLLCDGISTNV